MMGEIAEPTMGLRFVNGILQQQWIIRGDAPNVEWRDVPQCQPPQTSSTSWRRLTSADLDLSVRARRVMRAACYDRERRVYLPATLGQIADTSDVEILRTPECGRKTLKELRDMVEKMRTQPNP